MSDPVPALLKGTLDLLILRTLELQPLHGAAIAERIFQTTRGTFQIKAGSLFPALHRLEQALEGLGEIGDHLRAFVTGQLAHGLEVVLGVEDHAIEQRDRRPFVLVDQREVGFGGATVGDRPDPCFQCL